MGAADQLFFLIGGDAFAEIETWRRWREVVGSVTFIVANRPGHEYEVPQGASMERLETVDLPYSSSAIRRALGAGERPSEVPEPVLDYIYKHGLYGVPVQA